jgi:glycosyltransferase involved in cell wall biosynthesis
VRVAVVHDWLESWRGGERVLAEVLRMYPEADLFALVDFLSDADRKALLGKHATTSFIQKIPFAKNTFRLWLPLFPRAIESLDLSSYDLVISSSHAVAKGVMTHRGQVHICYCFTPMRYAWDLREQYLQQTGFDRGLRGILVRRILARLRAWDRAASARVDHFVAISRHIADRIRRCYDRESTVIYPPVAVASTAAIERRGKHYVTVSHLVPYKRVDLIVQAFARLPDHQLVIIGAGPERRRIETIAAANTRFLGQLPEHERDYWVATARAFVFAAEEDFGIAPLEAQALGTPVIAYAGGASSETILGMDSDTPTGILYHEQTCEAIVEAVRDFERSASRIRTEACRDNARRFDVDRFRRDLAAFIDARVPGMARMVSSP